MEEEWNTCIGGKDGARLRPFDLGESIGSVEEIMSEQTRGFE